MRAKLIAWAYRHGVTGVALDELMDIVCGPAVAVTTLEPAYISETAGGNRARELVQQWGGWLMRNNNGVATREGDGRPVRYGLGNDSAQLQRVCKSSDYCGLAPRGRFLAVEWKRRGWTYSGDDRERAQAAFLKRVNELGGIGTFATCVGDVARAINQG